MKNNTTDARSTASLQPCTTGCTHPAYSLRKNMEAIAETGEDQHGCVLLFLRSLASGYDDGEAVIKSLMETAR